MTRVDINDNNQSSNKCPENGFFEDFRPFEGGFDPRKRPDLEGSWDSSYEP
jgi:hypothetical protein